MTKEPVHCKQFFLPTKPHRVTSREHYFDMDFLDMEDCARRARSPVRLLDDAETRILKLWEEASCRIIPECLSLPSVADVRDLSTRLYSVIGWAFNILERCESNAETTDVSMIVFFEYVMHVAASDQELLDDVPRLSKVAACCIVLGSKLHETKRKVQLASFTFASLEEMVALEIEILTTVDMRSLAVSPALLARDMAETWVPCGKGLPRAAQRWVQVLISQSCCILAGAHTVAAAVLLLAVEEHSTADPTVASLLSRMPQAVRACILPPTTHLRNDKTRDLSVTELLYFLRDSPLSAADLAVTGATLNSIGRFAARMANGVASPNAFSSAPPELTFCHGAPPEAVKVPARKHSPTPSPTSVSDEAMRV